MMRTLRSITFPFFSLINKVNSEHRRLFIRFRSDNLYVRILYDTNNLLGK